MKRSEVNAIMRDADGFMRGLQFHLPPFAYWTPAEWAAKGEEVSEIVQHQLGWDITDFGSGDFAREGLFLFTLRNGTAASLESGTGKVYAEKIMIVDVDQVTPMHFHWSKTEDIINRGGGRLRLQLFNATPADDLADTDVTVSLDGVRQTLRAGAIVELVPGASITLPTRLYHTFWGAGSRVLVGEVSAVNDDNTDNRFRVPAGRFPEIEEDEAPLYLLVGDYAEHFRPGASG